MKRLKISNINICDVYVILYMLYRVFVWYVHSSMHTTAAFVPMLLIVGFSVCKTIFLKKRNHFINALLLFIGLLLFYGLIGWLTGSYGVEKPYSFLLIPFTNLAPVCLFYYYTLESKVTEEKIQLYYFIFIIMAIMEYFVYFSNKDVEGIITNKTNNASYAFVSLLPLLFIFSKKIILQFVFLAISLFFVMSAMKRGAIVCAVFFLLLFIYDSLKNTFGSYKKNKIIPILAFLTFFGFLLYWLFENVWMENEYFYNRLELTSNGDTNYRDWIYANLWNHFINDTNIFEFLFGIGAEGTIYLVGFHAHNDWLELLTDCGLFGIIIYIYYFMNFMFFVKNNRKNNGWNFVTACFIILLLRTFFSMSYMDMYLSISVALGYGLAKCQMSRLSKNNNNQ